MKIQEMQSTNIFFVNEKNEIEEKTIYDFIMEYCRDETTTPHGVAPRLFVKTPVLGLTSSIYTWGFDGNHKRFLEEFGTEEEALEQLLNWQLEENHMTFVTTREEAEQCIADLEFFT